MVLTWRAAALAGLVVAAAAVTGSGWALLGFVPVALLIAADVWLCASPRRTEIVRGGDTSIRLGESADVWVLVRNTGRRRLRATVRDAWTPSAGARGGVGTIDVPRGQRRRHETVLHPTRRGDRAAGPVVLRCLGPMGIAGRQRNLTAPWQVRVLAPFASRKHLPSRIARLRELDGRSTILQRGQGTEFDSLREYVPGDDVRSIDWRGTARSSTVVVKTWRPERDRHVLIVIDSGRTSAGRVGDQPRLDHELDAALLLGALAGKAGDRVDLLVVDRSVRASVVRVAASEFLSRAVNATANVEATLAESDYRALVTESLARVSQRSLVVILTGLDRASIEEGLLPAAAPLLRKHKVIVATVSDPRLDEMRESAESIGDVFAAAAAEADESRRRTTAAELRRHGVSVVSAPPERFAPELADRYLALKKSGRL
ncbi:DUF58 domain-containing protein [Propionicicella superfundia]|uniref:DUF58 domain-containing protein n=1 Tax=Propionicicella superfundia TaxID=348582 RepID=UPI0003F9D460|nr:DUF58 domain-containing protein [Propionicicella superfundia]